MGISFPSTIMEAASGRLHNSGEAASGGLPTVVESIVVDGKLIPIPDQDHFVKKPI